MRPRRRSPISRLHWRCVAGSGLVIRSWTLYANPRDQGETTAACLSETRREAARRGTSADPSASRADRDWRSASEADGVPCAASRTRHAAHAAGRWPPANAVALRPHPRSATGGEWKVRNADRALFRAGESSPLDRRSRRPGRAFKVDERSRGARCRRAQPDRRTARHGLRGPLPREGAGDATRSCEYASLCFRELPQAFTGDVALVVERSLCFELGEPAPRAVGVAAPRRVDPRAGAIAAINNRCVSPGNAGPPSLLLAQSACTIGL